MSLLDVALRQSLLTERVKLGRNAALRSLSFDVSAAVHKTFYGKPDDAYATMTKAQFLSFTASIMADVVNAYSAYSESTLEWIGGYIEFDVMMASILYASELQRAVTLVDKNRVFSTFSNTILPTGATPAKTLAGLSAFAASKVAARVRIAQSNVETPAQTLQALVGDDKLRGVGSILKTIMNATKAIDATLVQGAHIATNSAVMGVA